MLEVEFQRAVPLAPLTTIEVGGPAEYYYEARSVAELAAALRHAHDRDMPVIVLGGGSNVVFPDEGVAGLVLRNAITGIRFREDYIKENVDTVLVDVAAGAQWDFFVRIMVHDYGYGGIECLAGIPGTVGATPIQNVGAYGQEVAESIDRVVCLDRLTLKEKKFKNVDCDFAYRDSRFKSQDRDRYVVTRVTYRLRKNAEPVVRYAELKRRLEDHVAAQGETSQETPHDRLKHVCDTVLELRRGKSMVLDDDDPNSRSCGSFFMNPLLTAAEFEALRARCNEAPPSFEAGDAVKVPAAWLIERAGFAKGYRPPNSGAGISEKHSLAIVNYGNASARDVRELAAEIQAGVEKRFGVRLLPEPWVVR